MPKRLHDWLPQPKGLFSRAKAVIASAIVAGAGLSQDPLKASHDTGSSAPTPVEPVISNRSKRVGKVLLRLPGTSSQLLAQHRSHASHASHASGSSGPVQDPAPAAASTTAGSTSRQPVTTGAAVAAPLTTSTSRPAVVGTIEKIDPARRSVTIKDDTPLEATIEFFYDEETKFTPFGGTARALLNGTTLPIVPKEKVSVQWVPHPTNPSRKILVSVVERR
jgi:hypothetical protein